MSSSKRTRRGERQRGRNRENSGGRERVNPVDSSLRSSELTIRQILMHPLAIVFLVLCAAATGAGIIVHAVASESPWGWIGFLGAPAVYAAAVGGAVFLGRRDRLGSVTRRLAIGTLVVPLPLAVLSALVHPVALLVPSYRAAALAPEQDSIFSEVENVLGQIVIVPLIVLIIGMITALGIALMVAMPLVALRNPSEVAEDTYIERSPSKERDAALRLTFVGMSPLIGGITMWVASDGGDLRSLFRTASWVLHAVAAGYAPRSDEVIFVIGGSLVGIGLLMIAVGCVIALGLRGGARVRRGSGKR